MHQTIHSLQKELEELGSSLLVLYGKPEEVWQKLAKKYEIASIFCNRDYEPYAQQRDAAIAAQMEKKGSQFLHFKDHVIFEGGEVLKKDGLPYTVFTPYSRKWKEKLNSRLEKETFKGSYYLKPYPTQKYFSNLLQTPSFKIPTLEKMGFKASDLEIPSQKVSRGLIRNYGETRNFPAILGTSRLGIHFRFGTISIREKANGALSLSEVFLSELIWRDFYSSILYHFPKVLKGPFRDKYQWIEWNNNEEEFAAWCAGKTGYPIVDAGMRELNATGYMHNRVRMVVASFLTKHLLIDWQWGEHYFAEKLLDFDLASNNGGWQWAAGCGTDAAPYFRIFNPLSQQKKFDADFKYIKKWVPEYGTEEYVEPIVDHKFARERCLATYKAGLEKAASQ